MSALRSAAKIWFVVGICLLIIFASAVGIITALTEKAHASENPCETTRRVTTAEFYSLEPGMTLHEVRTVLDGPARRGTYSTYGHVWYPVCHGSPRHERVVLLFNKKGTRLVDGFWMEVRGMYFIRSIR